MASSVSDGIFPSWLIDATICIRMIIGQGSNNPTHKPAWWRVQVRISIFGQGRETFLRGGCPPQRPPTVDPLHPLSNPQPSCSTFSPGSSEVSECGQVGWCLATVTVRLNAGSLSPLWSQPVSCWASQAAAESVSLWRKWRLEELDQTPPTSGFLWGRGAGFTHYQRQDDSWLVSFSDCWGAVELL